MEEIVSSSEPLSLGSSFAGELEFRLVDIVVMLSGALSVPQTDIK